MMPLFIYTNIYHSYVINQYTWINIALLEDIDQKSTQEVLQNYNEIFLSQNNIIVLDRLLTR